ncbi:hypothetical protein [Zymomonas mobilis]|uniref:Uncharacterized protein n=1 Tax=Zymomonas mobilis subsp. pomaceae (strain ATCC 29192 / DSM 22645 / JCM 10191 / CCUG 17912 / NBRC 13757 / NCIMB 11200 / NRRL B-4491 / Barker I) TaxID=579138 RepID=F8ETX8_ZYMMT|nr:hypothetical protein [Zymomonas mobilis]AEI38075.1 hypothetical protein Zymop_1180 [Zymomonas mobilis subsp. pomaceae ATCC 29192]MDX5949441.1 hypothetical protein [Zymomonas mobilis subsp. pomaceae]GEB89184.1 hypothetical protein ZMO02_08210 [Zymomonas mobilis subsp. pomaceae]
MKTVVRPFNIAISRLRNETEARKEAKKRELAEGSLLQSRLYWGIKMIAVDAACIKRIDLAPDCDQFGFFMLTHSHFMIFQNIICEARK